MFYIRHHILCGQILTTSFCSFHVYIAVNIDQVFSNISTSISLYISIRSKYLRLNIYIYIYVCVVVRLDVEDNSLLGRERITEMIKIRSFLFE